MLVFNKVYLMINQLITHFMNNWISYILMILSLLGTIAFSTLAERKFMGSIQRRKGPDVVGFLGLLQAIADGVKLLFKQIVLPYKVSMVLFLIGPTLVFFLSLCGWVVIPFSDMSFASVINYAVLFVFLTSGFNIYGLVLSGWSSNSRYAFLGGIRATAQMISYELVFGMINLFIFFLAGSFNFTDIVKAQINMWFIIPLFPVFIIYLIVMLAETNRTPFDLAEAEAELVAGYNVEYSSITFALFFLGEYANMIFLSVLGTIYFLGGWTSPFGLHGIGLSGFGEIFFIVKVLLFFMFFIWIRATLPRYRYDQLMELAWKSLLPFLFSFFLCLISFVCFWKSLFFQLSVFLVVLLNIVHFIFYLISNISIIEQNISYDYVLKNNIYTLSILRSVKDSGPYFILHPIKECLEIYVNVFYSKYFNFYYFTNKTVFYKTILSTISLPDTYNENLDKIYKPFFYLIQQDMTEYTNSYNFNYFVSKLMKGHEKLLVIDSKFAEIEQRINGINRVTNMSIKVSDMFNQKTFSKQFEMAKVTLINKCLHMKFGNDLTIYDRKNLMTEICHIEAAVCKQICALKQIYMLDLKAVLEYQNQKSMVINSILHLLLQPVLAPFIFLFSVYEHSYYQVLQIFPWDLAKSPYGSIIKDQAIINAKYI